MSSKPPAPPAKDPHAQREAIFRGLGLINSFNLCVLALVALLAFVAIFLGLKARRDAETLWNASVTQARASRFGGEVGWKKNALATLARASEVRPSLALRNEAISALATLDLEQFGSWHPWRPGDMGLAFSPRLDLAAIRGSDDTIRVMNLATGATVRELAGVRSVRALAFDPRGEFLACRDRAGRLIVWAVDSWREVLSLLPASNELSLGTLAFCQNSVVITLPGGKLQFYSLSTGQPSDSLAIGAECEALAADPSGEKLGLLRGQDIEIWDLARRQSERLLHCPAEIGSFALAPGARYVAAGGGDTRVYLWPAGGAEMRVLHGHQGLVFRVVFNASGTLLASCAFGGTTRLWAASSGTSLLAAESLFIEHFGLDGASVACSRVEAGFGLARLNDSGVTRSLGLAGPADPPISCDFAGPDQALVTDSRGTHLLDLSTGSVSAGFPLPRARRALFDRARAAVFTTSLDGLQRWPLRREASGVIIGSPESIPVKEGVMNEALVISRDDSEALGRVEFEGAALVDLARRTELAFFPVANIGSLALSSDKELIATSTFHGAGTRIWRRTGELLKDLAGRDAGVDFSPDGKWLAAISSDRCTLYDTASWNPLHVLPMESASGLPSPAVFSPDGQTLAFTKQQRIVKLLAPASGAEIASLMTLGSQQITSLAFAPGGQRLVAGLNNATLQIWELGRLEANLAPLRLDWPAHGPDSFQRTQPESTIGWVAALSAAAVLAALGFALVAWIRHREFMAAYARIEQMIAQRNEELALAQAELFQGQKMRALGTLSAGVAHDFNNLLSVIRLSNQITAEDTRDNPDLQENARVIEKAIAQGKRVIRSLLGYAASGNTRERYAVGEVLEQTISLLAKPFLAGVRLTLDIPAHLPPVLGTRARLEQVLLNLIVNAAEAMDAQGELRFTLRRADHARGDYVLPPAPAAEYLELEIADSGPGIAPEVQNRIFEPFFTTKTIGHERGTGLGLALVYAMAQEEGLGLGLKSFAGQGTTFRLLLPIEAKKTLLPKASEMAKLGAG